MRIAFVVLAAAYLGLFVAGEARAVDNPPSCQTSPAASGCPGPGPGPDDPPPDPNPCDLDPSLCEPPPDPCTVDPSLCPEEPPDEQPPLPVVHRLEGTFRFKVPGFVDTGETNVELAYDDTNFSYDLSPGCNAATGMVVAKGRKGRKLQLFLSDESLDAFAEDLAASARRRAGRGGAVVGKTSKVILKKLDGGDQSLKIKVQVAVADLGEVVFKANLVDFDAEPTSSLRALCPVE
jgi:hypothetical protein